MTVSVSVGLRREWIWGELEDEDGEGLERRGVEECGGKRSFGGGAEVGEAFEDGELVDELVDVWNIRWGGETDACEEWVTRWGWVW